MVTSILNTSMYQPNYGLGTNNLNTDFSLGNYTNMSNTSIFQGQSINSGYCYPNTTMAPVSPMAPQQNNSEAFMQQIVLLLLSTLVQKQNQDTSTVTEQTIINDDGPAPAAAPAAAAPAEKPKNVVQKINDSTPGGKNEKAIATGGLSLLGDAFDGW